MPVLMYALLPMVNSTAPDLGVMATPDDGSCAHEAFCAVDVNEIKNKAKSIHGHALKVTGVELYCIVKGSFALISNNKIFKLRYSFFSL